LRAECVRPQKVDEVGVIGTLGTLIEVISEGGGSVADRNLIRVISWFLQDLLPINVVLERVKAMELVNTYPDQQFQIAELLKSCEFDWNEPVEHRIREFGNPVYLRYNIIQVYLSKQWCVYPNQLVYQVYQVYHPLQHLRISPATFFSY